jgi:hypothetical protein
MLTESLEIPFSRAETIEKLVRAGNTRAEASIVADLAEHAVAECINTLSRVARTAPRNLVAPTQLIAISLTSQALVSLSNEIGKSLIGKSLRDL